MNNQEIIENLISIGEQIEIGVCSPDISNLVRYSRINRMGKKTRSDEISNSSSEKIISLLIGIIYVERELKWFGGSAAGSIWIFAELLTRNENIEQIDRVAKWIIKNTRNQYSPFGTQITLGARNYSEYIKLSNERDILIQKEVAKDKDIELEALKQRNVRQEKRALNAQLRSKVERVTLIKRLQGMSVKDQLLLISNDEVYAPTFYPTKCADSATTDIIRTLSNDAKYRLVIKLKGKHRGPWGAFKKRLISESGVVSDRAQWKI